jgi:hypothetical protein
MLLCKDRALRRKISWAKTGAGLRNTQTLEQHANAGEPSIDLSLDQDPSHQNTIATLERHHILTMHTFPNGCR